MMMTTKTAVLAILSADPSITDAQRKSAIEALEGKSICGIVRDEPLDQSLTRDQVAKILSCSKKTVSNYAKSGIIRRFRLGAKQTRATGYSANSVREALARSRDNGEAKEVTR